MKVYLKKGRDKAVRNRHMWIFSGAIGRIEEPAQDGSIAGIYDSTGEFLGSGHFNAQSDISVRMLSFGAVFTLDTLRALIRSAVARRTGHPLLDGCNAYRLIFSEADLVPGLIVDQYAGHLVCQILTLGMETMKDDLFGILTEECNPRSIYERSDHAGRSAEGLPLRSGQISGTTPRPLQIEERGLAFMVDVHEGQKTGFFLDQRDSRSLVKTMSAGKQVLNLFCYTGGFTVAAYQGGAASVISVDASAPALDAVSTNLQLNNIAAPTISTRADVFSYIRETPIEADFVILDPPAFIKSRDTVNKGLRGYKDINYQVFKKCPPRSHVLTFSCSRHIDTALFQTVVYQALLDSGRNGFILARGGHPADHPVNLYHPETDYLKSLLLFIE